jgi:hypothetical protein
MAATTSDTTATGDGPSSQRSIRGAAAAALQLATVTRVGTRRRDRTLAIGVASVAALLVFAGFARTYFLRSFFGSPALDVLVHVHGILFTSWFVLLATQVALVSAHRTALHRRLGVAGAALAALMLVVGVLTAVHFARRGGGVPRLMFIAIPLGILFTFGVLVAGALYYRRHSQTHRRLMLLATIALLPTAISRLPFAFVTKAGPLAYFGLTDVIVLVCLGHDFMERRRVHPAYRWGALVIAVSQPLSLFISRTSIWLEFARWLTR